MSGPVVVISGVNLNEGGPLTVLRECVASAAETLPSHWRLIVLVHRSDLINNPRVHLIEIPDAKRSWWRRMRWEWFGFKALSAELEPDLWLSLHDITSRVTARRQAVYCHNPAPFFSMTLREVFLEPKLWLFTRFYALLYRAFIHYNDQVIVQQAWLRDEFIRRFGRLPVVVAHPVAQPTPGTRPLRARTSTPFVFIYPALSRVFKNFEVIGRAVRLLNARQVGAFEVRITIDGSENRYARWLHFQFGDVPHLKFIGRQSAAQMSAQYNEAAALLFPSRLETWGLPITEAKARGLPMLVADARYAHETVGTYDQVGFFPSASAERLAEQMSAMITGNWQPQGQTVEPPASPFAADWGALWALMTNGLESSPIPASVAKATPAP